MNSIEVAKILRILEGIQSQQAETQQNVFELAYGLSVQLQLLEDIASDLSRLNDGQGVQNYANRLFSIREHLEKIQH